MGFIKIRVGFWILRYLVFTKHIPLKAIKCRCKGTIFPEYTQAIIQGKILCLSGVTKYCANYTMRSNLVHIDIFHLCIRIKHSNFSPNPPPLNKQLPHTIFSANMRLDPGVDHFTTINARTCQAITPTTRHPNQFRAYIFDSTHDSR